MGLIDEEDFLTDKILDLVLENQDHPLDGIGSLIFSSFVIFLNDRSNAFLSYKDVKTSFLRIFVETLHNFEEELRELHKDMQNLHVKNSTEEEPTNLE